MMTTHGTPGIPLEKCICTTTHPLFTLTDFFSPLKVKMLGVLNSRNTADLLYNLTIFVLYLTILTIILRYLWNSVLVKHISILRPVSTLLNTFLLALSIAIFRL